MPGMEVYLEIPLTEIIVTSFEGEINDFGQYHGQGLAVLDNGCSYEGNFERGLFHGRGRYSWPDKTTYEGDFKFGVMNGKGVYTWSDGSHFEGHIREGKRNGKGIFKCSSGQVYDGDWLDGKRHGAGKMSYNEEATISYSGDWVLGLRDGYGQMKYASGNTYEGEWSQDKKCGRGVMQWRSTDEVFVGDWVDDKPNGFGEHIWGGRDFKAGNRQVCNIYRGFWKDGRREGRGTFFYANGSQYSGDWADNQKHGEGVFVHSDGRITTGTYCKDRVVNPTETGKDSGDISVQVHLNISDVMAQHLPVISSHKAVSEKHNADNAIQGNAEVNATHLLQQQQHHQNPAEHDHHHQHQHQHQSHLHTQSCSSAEFKISELERLLLRYQSYLHNHVKRQADAATRKRLKEINLFTLTDSYVGSWPKVEQLLFQSRDIYKRFYCMSLDQFRRVLREINVMGVLSGGHTGRTSCFGSFDLTLCLREMRRHHNDVVHRLASSQGLSGKSLKIAPILDHEFLGIPGHRSDSVSLPGEHAAAFSFDNDPRQPLLQREVYELLIRCIARAFLRPIPESLDKVAQSDLFSHSFRIFSDHFEPLVSSGTSSQFFLAYYSESLQDMLRSMSLPTGPLFSFWQEIRAHAIADGVEASTEDPVAQLRHLVSFFRTTGKLSSGATVRDILLSIHAATPATTPPKPASPVIPVEVQTKAGGSMKKLSMKSSMKEKLPVLPIVEETTKNDVGVPSYEVDLSCLRKLVDFDDFIYFLCRLIASDLWDGSSESSAAEPVDDRDSHDDDADSRLRMMLEQRLANWLQSVESSKMESKQ